MDHTKIHGDILHNLYDLIYLESINLSDNQIHGSIPNLIGSLQYLESINLSNNTLDSTIHLPLLA